MCRVWSINGIKIKGIDETLLANLPDIFLAKKSGDNKQVPPPALPVVADRAMLTHTFFMPRLRICLSSRHKVGVGG